MRAYRCSHSGLLYPEKFVKQWSKYGRGMGPEPVSRVLDTMYHCAPAEHRRAELIMHPVRECRAQLDLCQVTEEEASNPANWAMIPESDDDFDALRDIMRSRQIKNKRCHVRVREAAKLCGKG